MRATALLVLLCGMVGSAQAAPAADAQVKSVVDQLGLGSLGASMAQLMIDNTPALKALDGPQQECARKPVQEMLDQEFRRSMIAGLGEDGDQVMAEWTRFLATPAGRALSTAFANASAETVAAKAGDGLAGNDRAALEAFLRGPAYTRFVASFDQSSPVPEDSGARLAQGLQDQCRIALTPEDVS